MPTARDELLRLKQDRTLPLGILLQRRPTPAIDAAGKPTVATAHLDLATSSVADEVARHEGWGARVLESFPRWTTMADPVGRTYCITDRNPRTGE